MEIIEDLEPVRRGLYAGAVGHISTTHGNLDLCIAIRTLVYANGRAYWGAGAGIVADSDPDRRVAGDAQQGARAVDRGRSAPEQGGP